MVRPVGSEDLGREEKQTGLVRAKPTSSGIWVHKVGTHGGRKGQSQEEWTEAEKGTGGGKQEADKKKTVRQEGYRNCERSTDIRERKSEMS